MNLDVERFEDPDYYLKIISDQYQLDLGEGGFDILNFGLTWKDRTAVDHCFINKPEAIKKYGKIQIDPNYSDHCLIYVEIEAQVKRRQQEKFQCRDMRKLRSNPSYFIKSLLKHNWDSMAFMNDVDEMEEFYSSSILQSLNEVAEMKWRNPKKTKHKLPPEVQIEVKKRISIHDKFKTAQKLFLNKCEIMKGCKKAFRCSQCDKTFNCSSEKGENHGESREKRKKDYSDLEKRDLMKEHEKVHTNEKPFSCHKCDKKFVAELDSQHRKQSNHCKPLLKKAVREARGRNVSESSTMMDIYRAVKDIMRPESLA